MMTNPTGRLTQGQFSFLPDLTDPEIAAQIQYGLDKGYAWSVEYTDDPHPRNTYWEMFGMPMFDLPDAAGVLAEILLDTDAVIRQPAGDLSGIVRDNPRRHAPQPLIGSPRHRHRRPAVQHFDDEPPARAQHPGDLLDGPPRLGERL